MACTVTNAPPTGPRMAPGVGGFNIDPLVPRASRVEGEATSRTRDAERCQDRAFEQGPIRVQRMALIVERRESSATPSAKTSAHQPRLVVENQSGFANEPLPLGILVKDGLGVEAVMVAGLANGIELSLGTFQGSTGWLVTARDLDKTFIGTPQDFVGVMDATVTLRSPLGDRLDRQLIRFECLKKKQEHSMPTFAPTAPMPGLPPLDSEQVARMVKLGRDLLKHGDVGSARFLLKRAAIAGHAEAALELGLSFDGTVPAQSGVLGSGSDVGQAREWYERAIKLGSAEASRHLERLVSMPK